MSRPWVKFLLIASLALNLLVVGALAGMALRGPGARWGGGAAGGGANMFAYLAQLPKERREALLRRGNDLRPQIRDLRETSRTAARDAQQTLAAEPFDRARFIAAQSRQIEADMKLRGLMRDAAAEVAAQMSVEERRAFVSWRGQRRMLGANDPLLDETPKKP